MTFVHLHLVLNHFPLFSTLIGLVLLLVALLRHSRELMLSSLLMLIIGAALAAGVFLTGEPAEDAVEHLAGIQKAAIERHESAATSALIAIEVLGALALLSVLLQFRLRRIPQSIVVACLLTGIVALGLMGWTANLGGQIRHAEIAKAMQSREHH